MRGPEARHVGAFRQRRGRRQGGQPPARHCCRGLGQNGIGVPTAAPQREPRHSGCLGGKLQSPRGGQAQLSANLPDHSCQSRRAQPLLHGEQHCLRVAGFGIHHAMGCQTYAGESGCEQVGSLQHPEHVAAHPGEPACNEQRCRGAVLHLGAGADNLMQRAARQAATGKMPVDHRYAECCYRFLPPGRPPFQPRNASAKRCKRVVLNAGGGTRGHLEHIKNMAALAKPPLSPSSRGQCLTNAILL